MSPIHHCMVRVLKNVYPQSSALVHTRKFPAKALFFSLRYDVSTVTASALAVCYYSDCIICKALSDYSITAKC